MKGGNMDIHEYLRLIQEAEQKTDLNRYTYQGIQLWPLLRAQVLNMFRTPEAYNKPLPPLSHPAVSFLSKLKARRRARQCLHEFRMLLSERFSNNQKNAELLFFSRGNTHSDIVNDKAYDRFTDPFIEFLDGSGTHLKLELTEGTDAPGPERYIPSVQLPIDLFREYAWNRSQYKHVEFLSETAAFRELCAWLPFQFNVRHVDSAFREILFYRELFAEIFKVLTPRYVFLKCYYEHDAAGLVAAAREAGIKTVDIQHGKQGTHHPMYSHWTNIPPNGYALLPDYFWNWADESRNNIANWMNRKNVHVPVTGGNLWLAKWKHQDFYTLSSAAQAVVNKWKQASRVILVSLQPLEHDKVIPATLAEAIRKSPSDWVWLLRKHPFQKLKTEDIKAMTGESAAELECEYASSLPLYFLLRHIHHHVTQWSSVAFEASDFGVPTIIIHETGRKLYADHLQRNVFSWAGTADEIMQLIMNNEKNVAAGYIETDYGFANAALRQIGITAEVSV